MVFFKTSYTYPCFQSLKIGTPLHCRRGHDSQAENQVKSNLHLFGWVNDCGHVPVLGGSAKLVCTSEYPL